MADIDELVKYINGEKETTSKNKRNTKANLSSAVNSGLSSAITNVNSNNDALSPNLTKKQRQRLKKKQQVGLFKIFLNSNLI